MERKVTELDFRMPGFRDAKVEDYEFRADGKLVRKDRWEQAVQSIRHLVGIDTREFEIPDVVEAVRQLAKFRHEWNPIDDLPEQDGWYLVVQDNGILRHRFARQYTTLDGWKDLKEDKYGEATHWTTLTPFPKSE